MDELLAAAAAADEPAKKPPVKPMPRRGDDDHQFAMSANAIDFDSIFADFDSPPPVAPVASEDAEVDLSVAMDGIKPPTAPVRDKEPQADLDGVFGSMRDQSAKRTGLDDAEKEYKRGLALRAAGDIDGCIQALEKASRAPKLRFGTSWLIARLYRERDMMPQALEWLERRRRRPRRPPTNRSSSCSSWPKGSKKSAKSRALAVCIELRPTPGACAMSTPGSIDSPKPRRGADRRSADFSTSSSSSGRPLACRDAVVARLLGAQLFRAGLAPLQPILTTTSCAARWRTGHRQPVRRLRGSHAPVPRATPAELLRDGAMICLVTDRRRLVAAATAAAAAPGALRARLVAQVRHAVDAGIDLIQVRERDLEARALAALVTELLAVTRGTPTRLVVNDRMDVALACGADGVHLRGDSIPIAMARRIAPPSGFSIARSVHGVDEAIAAGADYLIAGTVFRPRRSRDRRLCSVLRAAGNRRGRGCPVLAIGGIAGRSHRQRGGGGRRRVSRHRTVHGFARRRRRRRLPGG